MNIGASILFFVLSSLGQGPEVPRKLVKYEVPVVPVVAAVVRADGEVKLQIKVDEEGRVLTAIPTGGHPLLRKAAADAARGWRFAKGEPASLDAVIVFNMGKKNKAKLRKPYRLEYTYQRPKIMDTINYDTGLVASIGSSTQRMLSNR